MRFEEFHSAFVFGEVDPDVTVGHLPGADAVVADRAHEPGELDQSVGHELSSTRQIIPQRDGDRCLEVSGTVVVD